MKFLEVDDEEGEVALNHKIMQEKRRKNENVIYIQGCTGFLDVFMRATNPCESIYNTFSNKIINELISKRRFWDDHNHIYLIS